MKNQRGAIKLITAIGIILIIVIILFGVVVFTKINSRNGEEDKQEGNMNTVTEDSTNIANTTNEIDTPTSQISGGTEEFSLKFLQMENNQKNMIYSPLSIKYGLSMLKEGAEGNTYNQINNVLGNTNLPTYRNIEKELSIANSVFIRNTYSQYVKQDFINTLTNKYNAEVKYDDFANATNVNNWIDNKTFGIIKNMVSDDLVQNPDTKMLLINALAIDMEWEEQFSADETRGETFTKEDGTEITATMMNQETSSDDVSYYIGDDVTALTMNLEDEDDIQLEFMAIMPNENLKQYVENLTTQNIDEITSKLTLASQERNGIKIKIPKFSFDYDLNFKEDLQQLGITDAFNPDNANFSKMANLDQTKGNLYVGEALHKADMDFTEEGVRAAAVTVFAMMEEAMIEPTQPKEVKFDKPFLFLIRDKNTKEIWFTGTVYEPNLWDNDKADYGR